MADDDRLFVAFTTIAAYIALAVCVTAVSAPVPPPKTKKAEVKKANPHLGGWRMQWGTGEGDVVFNKDGGYWCMWNNQQWVGTWSLVGDKLNVQEGRVSDRPDDVPGPPLDWTVTLGAGGLSGTVSNGGRFRLHRGEPERLPMPRAD